MCKTYTNGIATRHLSHIDQNTFCGGDGTGLQPVSLTQPVSPTQATTYRPNALNQYTSISRTNPLRRVLQGIAHPGATIEVKMDSPTGETRTVARVEPNGAGFIAEAEADTSLAAVWRQVVVEASRPGVGVNGAIVKTKRTGWLFFPPQNETLVYDQDGNLKEDARWLYTWDGENRLVTMEEKQIANSSLGQTPPARQRLEFAYDSQSRRVRKVVKVLQGQTWSVTSDLRFVYDTWNMIAEFSLQNSALILQRSYAWGYDLSGSEQGAGGVGGLVLVKSRDAGSTTVNNSNPSSTVSAPAYDGNGNILAYLDCPTGNVTQQMEYDAFGNELTLDSVLTGNNTFVREVPFRFSTKYADTEINLSYYGYRYYSAEMGRWLNRDPIGEEGGLNIYGMLGNVGVNKIDLLGNCTCEEAKSQKDALIATARAWNATSPPWAMNDPFTGTGNECCSQAENLAAVISSYSCWDIFVSGGSNPQWLGIRSNNHHFVLAVPKFSDDAHAECECSDLLPFILDGYKGTGNLENPNGNVIIARADNYSQGWPSGCTCDSQGGLTPLHPHPGTAIKQK